MNDNRIIEHYECKISESLAPLIINDDTLGYEDEEIEQWELYNKMILGIARSSTPDEYQYSHGHWACHQGGDISEPYYGFSRCEVSGLLSNCDKYTYVAYYTERKNKL